MMTFEVDCLMVSVILCTMWGGSEDENASEYSTQIPYSSAAWMNAAIPSKPYSLSAAIVPTHVHPKCLTSFARALLW